MILLQNMSFGFPGGNLLFNHINLTIQSHTKSALVGSNGMGKSTLLKLISGVTKPNAGQVEVKGAIASLLDIGAGFHPDLSGLENIYLMGQLQGISEKVSKEFVDDIIAFIVKEGMLQVKTLPPAVAVV